MRLLFGFLLVSLFISCNNKDKIPDVSNINITLSTQRFEKDFFNLDTINFTQHFNQLLAKYPSFAQHFSLEILGADPKWSKDSIASYAKGFINSYKNVYDSSTQVFNNFIPYENEVKKGLQFVKYYFPNYKMPQKIITYIGPVDGFGDILSDDALIVGLQIHLGKKYSLYQTDLVQQTYPDYMSRRFEPNYIAINCINNIVLDMFPEKLEDKTLVQQMVEKGKRLFILHKLLPYEDEDKLIGYAKQQYKECFDNEQKIWAMFAQNNLLQSIDENIIKNYIGDAPKTQELGDASPGNIGSFAGWQIVKKYMNKNPSLDLQKLMTTDNDIILQEAKYKP